MSPPLRETTKVCPGHYVTCMWYTALIDHQAICRKYLIHPLIAWDARDYGKLRNES